MLDESQQIAIAPEQLWAIADSLPVPAWIADGSGQLQHVNQAVLDYLQLSEAEVISGGWQEAIHPEDTQGLLDLWHHSITTGTSFDGSFRKRDGLEGTYRPFHIHATPVAQGAVSIGCWFGINYLVGKWSLPWTRTDEKAQVEETGNYVEHETEQRRDAVQALRRSEKLFRAMVEHNMDAVALLDEAARITYVGPQSRLIMGYAPEEVLGLSGFELVHPDDLHQLQDVFKQLLASPEAVTNHQYRLRHKDGRWRWVISTAKNLLHDSDIHAVVLNYRDVTDQLAAEEALKKSDERFRLVVQATNDAVYDWNILDGSIWWNENVHTLLRFPGEATDFSIGWWSSRLHPDDQEAINDSVYAAIGRRDKTWSGEYRFRRGDETYAYFYDRGYIQYSSAGEAERMIGSMMDITARKLAEQELVRGAFHDTLTGLANRSAFLEHLERAVGHAFRRPDYQFAVLFLDLDRFKLVNDGLGHAAGDELLIAVAKRLEDCLRPGDLVARLGGDEFVLLLDDIRDVEDATRVADRVEHKLCQPFDLGHQEAFITASIGIAVSTSGYKNPEDVLRDADTAMYRAKALGKARYQIFDVEMHKRTVNRLQLENDMRRGFERNEFDLHYQPIVLLEENRIVGFEALMRWHHPQRGMVSPADFIPIAEETGHIVPMGWWAIEHACNWLKNCQGIQSQRQLFVTVNVSPRQFEQVDFFSALEQLLKRTGLPPSSLKLEITENTMMQYSATTTGLMLQLRGMNVELYVDDFGTGHSSLSYLHRFPIDALKIDRSFVQELESTDEGQEIVRAIVALGAAMKMKTVAEGVETQEQARLLMQLGCKLGQGYFYSRPVNQKAACDLLHMRDPFLQTATAAP